MSETTSDVRARLRVTGRVQGVWYRASTRREAQRLGVRGWVRNRPDGSVEADVEGAEAQVQALIAWCRGGPPHARVDDVAITWDAPAGAAGFTIR